MKKVSLEELIINELSQQNANLMREIAVLRAVAIQKQLEEGEANEDSSVRAIGQKGPTADASSSATSRTSDNTRGK